MKKITFFVFYIVFFSGILSQKVQAQFLSEHSLKFAKIIELIEKYYVDSTDTEKLVEKAILEVMKNLDPHSIYIKRDDVQSINEQLQGHFNGVGIHFNIIQDTIWVIKVVENGPAEKVGILPGDRILSINNESVTNKSFKTKDVKERLGGEKDTQIVMKIKRRKMKEPLEFTMKRDNLPIYSIESCYMAAKRIAYIKLARFASTSVEEFRKALEKLRLEGVTSLILDLRGNSGGLLIAATDLADEFLNFGKLIVYTEGTKSPRTETIATAKGIFEIGKLVLLIDEGSASASEILSGAVQDWDRGVVVGRRSYGKGLVQRPFTLVDGSQVRITTARYYTPSGRLIQKHYEKGKNDVYQKDIANRYKHGELTTKDSIQFNDSLRFYTLEKKRKVFGGGGIMPDCFVAMDTSGYTDYFNDLVRKDLINDFCDIYLDEHRESFKVKYPTFKKFEDNFEANDEMLQQLIEFADSSQVPENNPQFEASKDEIKLRIKAEMASDIWSVSEYYQIINKKNETFRKAVDILNSKNKYEEILK